MVGLGAAPALVQFVLIIMLPESPRWLVKAGKSQEARRVLEKVYGNRKDDLFQDVLRAIKTEISEEDSMNDDVSIAETGNKLQVVVAKIRNRSAELFHIGSNRRALTIACLLQGLQQLCGFVSSHHFQ